MCLCRKGKSELRLYAYGISVRRDSSLHKLNRLGLDVVTNAGDVPNDYRCSMYFGITTLSNNLSNFWVRLALDKIVY